MSKFDLHLHTVNSDGSDSTGELLQKVANAGISIFAITDHDTVDGILQAEEIIPEGLTFLRGVELTCKIDDIRCHILGYNINPKDEALNALIKKGKTLRKIKVDKRIDYLKSVWGIELTEDEKSWIYSRKSPVKTHFANILVKRGLAEDNVSAMKKYLDGCKTGNTKFDGREAIDVIKKAGGIPVWAHALGGEGEEHSTGEKFLLELETMINCGIEGLECYYSRYTLAEEAFLVDCAKKRGLLISGGSDYHGTNKTVLLGQLNTENKPIASDMITII